MNTCLIHFEGGELSGTIDEHIRHAITKISSYHFVSNQQSEKILLQMGENKKNIFNIGCPSYDLILNLKKDTKYLKNINQNNFDVEERDYILAVYHPVTTDLDITLKEYEIYVNLKMNY